jgi:hypothetical protein
VSFAVPAPRCQTSFQQPAATGSVSYGLLDVAGDGLPDLVVFSDACDATVGQTHWDVYLRGSMGLAAAPSPYAVPAPRCQASFSAPAGGAPVGYALLDATGDGLPDLVVFSDACDATVGQTHWDVYAGGASGFAAAPSAFTVPAPRCGTDFDQLYASGSLAYTLLDVTGDGHGDLVVTADACDATVGQTHWDVYSWSPAGFAATPASFAVPAPRCQASFDRTTATKALAYATLSLGGAGVPDLVVLSDACDATVGQTHWDRYPWSASGFAAAPTAFAVPAPRCKTDFASTSGTGAITFALADLTSDAIADLVVYADTCDTTVGQTHWDVYPWTSSGFAPAPTAFAVPAPRCSASFDAPSASGSVTFATMALTNACAPSLVVFHDGCDATVGTTHWDTYGQP